MGGEEVMAKTLISVFEYVRDYDGGFFASDTPFNKNDSETRKFFSSITHAMTGILFSAHISS